MDMNLQLQFEKAVRLLAKHFPVSEETSRKPALFHDIRVGVYLYEHGYPVHVVLAGALHDALEFGDIAAEILEEGFGEEVLGIVKACTKDETIEDKVEKTRDLVGRCIEVGQSALIVKAADTLDSFRWYDSQQNQEQLQYCVRNADAIFDLKPEDWSDKIFDELAVWYKKYL